MIGDASDSYVSDVCVHDSNARGIVIHAVSYLAVRRNVAINCFGHTIFLEDAIETYNVIEYNLVMGSKSSSLML